MRQKTCTKHLTLSRQDICKYYMERLRLK